MKVFLPIKSNRRGNQLLEYVLLTLLIIAGVVVGKPVLENSINARIKGYDDEQKSAIRDPMVQSNAPGVFLNCVEQPPLNLGCGACPPNYPGCNPFTEVIAHTYTPNNCRPSTYEFIQNNACYNDVPLECGSNNPAATSPCGYGSRHYARYFGSSSATPVTVCTQDNTCNFDCIGADNGQVPYGFGATFCPGAYNPQQLLNNTPISYVANCSSPALACQAACNSGLVPNSNNVAGCAAPDCGNNLVQTNLNPPEICDGNNTILGPSSIIGNPIGGGGQCNYGGYNTIPANFNRACMKLRCTNSPTEGIDDPSKNCSDSLIYNLVTYHINDYINLATNPYMNNGFWTVRSFDDEVFDIEVAPGYEIQIVDHTTMSSCPSNAWAQNATTACSFAENGGSYNCESLADLNYGSLSMPPTAWSISGSNPPKYFDAKKGFGRYCRAMAGYGINSPGGGNDAQVTVRIKPTVEKNVLIYPKGCGERIELAQNVTGTSCSTLTCGTSPSQHLSCDGLTCSYFSPSSCPIPPSPGKVSPQNQIGSVPVYWNAPGCPGGPLVGHPNLSALNQTVSCTTTPGKYCLGSNYGSNSTQTFTCDLGGPVAYISSTVVGNSLVLYRTPNNGAGPGTITSTTSYLTRQCGSNGSGPIYYDCNNPNSPSFANCNKQSPQLCTISGVPYGYLYQ